MSKRININFNHLGEGQMECVGLGTFRCLGKKGVHYPKDLMVNPALSNVKRHPYFSQEYVCNYPDIGEIGVPCRMNLLDSYLGATGHLHT